MLKNTRTRLTLLSLERRDVPSSFTIIETRPVNLGMKTELYARVTESLDKGDFAKVDLPESEAESKSASRPDRGETANVKKLIEIDRMERFGDWTDAHVILTETV